MYKSSLNEAVVQVRAKIAEKEAEQKELSCKKALNQHEIRKNRFRYAQAKRLLLAFLLLMIAAYNKASAQDIITVMHDTLAIDWDAQHATINPWLLEVTPDEIEVLHFERDNYKTFTVEKGSYADLAADFGTTEGFIRLYQCPDLSRPMEDLRNGDVVVLPATWFRESR